MFLAQSHLALLPRLTTVRRLAMRLRVRLNSSRTNSGQVDPPLSMWLASCASTLPEAFRKIRHTTRIAAASTFQCRTNVEESVAVFGVAGVVSDDVWSRRSAMCVWATMSEGGCEHVARFAYLGLAIFYIVVAG